jgi:putative ABC transport system ATP-binding protein
VIRIEGLHKTFNPGSVNAYTAIDGVDLTLADGDFVTVIGSNGAGKSSLLNLLAGIYPADEGSIHIDNKDVTKLPVHKRAADIGRVFQDPLKGTAARMTVEENMAIAARRGKRRGLAWGVKKEDRENFKHQLAKLGLGLEKRLGDSVGLLSGGQRQSITLLMATLLQPKVLLLDEHTAALDPKTAHLVGEITDRIVGYYKLTTLMVTHNMEQALKHGNRTIMMHRGKIIFDVSGEERKGYTVTDLLNKFHEQRESDEEVLSDRMMLS